MKVQVLCVPSMGFPLHCLLTQPTIACSGLMTSGKAVCVMQNKLDFYSSGKMAES
jgi:hypothetical protein